MSSRNLDTRGRRSLGRAGLRLAPVLAMLPLAVLPGGCAAAETTPERFDLTHAVPQDVFLVTGSRHNPDRQFLDDYWQGVWTRFLESGVPDEAIELVLSSADAEQRAEIERLATRFSGLCAEVDWRALGAGQIVFAERLRPPTPIGHGAVTGQPDMLFLVRTDPELARESHERLVALMEAAIEEVSALSDVPLRTRVDTLHGIPFTVFDMMQALSDAPELPIAVGRHDDVLVLAFGPGVAADVAALLAGVEGHRSVADDPRFRAAFAGLPTARDGFEFFDAQSLRRDLDRYAGDLLGMLRDARHVTADDHVENRIGDEEAALLADRGFAACEQGDHERALKLYEAAHELDPGSSLVLYNLACLHALHGQREEACEWLGRSVQAGFHAPAKIASDDDLASLRDEPAYSAALESARAGARRHEEAGLMAAESLVDRALDSLGILDYGATVHDTRGHATWSDSIAALTADAPDHAFHAVVAADRPVRSYVDRLPAESVSFSVTGGMDLEPLYDFAHAALAGCGPVGEGLLETWREAQQAWGLDVRADLLAPLGSDMISANLSLEHGDAWVWMLSVDDERAVATQLDRLMAGLPGWIAAASREAPPLAMLGLRIQPTRDAALPGFHEVVVGMVQGGMICGVSDGWLVAADSPATVRLVRDTAAGRHPDLRANERLVSAALLPEGPALRVSFTDHAGDAQAVAGVLRMIAASGGMARAVVSDQQAREALERVFGLVARLAPVVESIDFYESSSAHTTFDGRSWRTRSVTRYVPSTDGG